MSNKITAVLQAEVMKYVPTKKREAVRSAYINAEGYWIELEEGWEGSRTACTDKKIIHELSVADLRYQIWGIQKEGMFNKKLKENRNIKQDG